MKPRDSVLRLRRFQLDEKRRQVAQIERMIAEFERMAADLDAQIEAEHDRTGIREANHFAYSTFARAAGQRRANLHASAEELRAQLAPVRTELSEAEEEVVRLEAIAGRDAEREAEPAPAAAERGRRGRHPAMMIGRPA